MPADRLWLSVENLNGDYIADDESVLVTADGTRDHLRQIRRSLFHLKPDVVSV